MLFRKEVNCMDIKELESQRDKLDKQIKQYYSDKKDLVMSKNEGYVGKCYKRVLDNLSTLFIKITSIYDEYRACVMEFTSPMDLEDGVFNSNDYGLFCNSSTWDYVGNWTEITPVEFDEKMDVVYNRLKEIINIL